MMCCNDRMKKIDENRGQNQQTSILVSGNPRFCLFEYLRRRRSRCPSCLGGPFHSRSYPKVLRPHGYCCYKPPLDTLKSQLPQGLAGLSFKGHKVVITRYNSFFRFVMRNSTFSNLNWTGFFEVKMLHHLCEEKCKDAQTHSVPAGAEDSLTNLGLLAIQCSNFMQKMGRVVGSFFWVKTSWSVWFQTISNRYSLIQSIPVHYTRCDRNHEDVYLMLITA